MSPNLGVGCKLLPHGRGRKGYLLMIGVLLLLGLLMAFPANLALGATPSLSLYDDFSGASIDAAKWTNLELVREIQSGKLVSGLRAFGPPPNPHNNLPFANPTAIQSFRADVRMNAVSALSSRSGRLRLMGSFYNNGTAGSGAIGDVRAQIYLYGSQGNVSIHYHLYVCMDAECSTINDVFAPEFVKLTALGAIHKLGIAWDGSKFTFNVDDVLTDVTPPVGTKVAPKAPLKVLGTFLALGAEDSVSVSGDFDNVYVNGNLYDDFDGPPFSGPRLDPTKWGDLERVREIATGRLVSKTVVTGSAGTSENWPIRPVNQNAVSTMRADVSVTEYQSSNSGVQARLAGWYYNNGDSTGPDDYKGNVAAYIRIFSKNGAPLAANFEVARCDNADCSTETTFATFALGPVNPGETHNLLLAWDGSQFTYGMDGVTSTYDPTSFAPVVKAPPGHFKDLRTRVHVSSNGGYGYIAANFDNVYVNETAAILPALTPFRQITLAGDVTSKGVGLRGTGAGTINLTTIPGGATVEKAYLYWVTIGKDGTFTGPTLKGSAVDGALIGRSDDPFRGMLQSFAYRADVASIVTGNDNYAVAGLPNGTGGNDTLGAGLVVIYSIPGYPTKTIVINDGAVTLAASRLESYATTLSGFVSELSEAGPTLTFIVGDGQSFMPERAWLGTHVLSLNEFNGGEGDAWDTRTYGIFSLMPAGETSATAIISTQQDALVWVVAVLSVAGSPPVKPTVTVTAPDATATEAGPTSGTFRISRTGDTSSALTVYYSVGGSASGSTDYPALPGSVIIPAGGSIIDIPVTPFNDTTIEGNETVVLTLSARTAYIIGSPSSATVTILSDEIPTVNVAVSDATATETGPTTGRFTISHLGSTTAPLTVYYSVGGTATAGSDYTTLAGSVTIPAGSTSASVYVNPIDDAIAEAPETVILTLIPNTAYTLGTGTTGTVTITSDEVPTVTITAPDPTATEAGPTSGTFRISRTGELNAPLTVNFSRTGSANAGTDYATFPTSLIIPAGASFGDITVTPFNDTTIEANETVILTLTTSANYIIGSPSSATVTIESDEKPTVNVQVGDSTATELPTTSGRFTISHLGSTSAPLTVFYSVSGTATAGDDYTALTGSVTIPAGSSSASVYVNPIDDAIAEAPETVILTLTPNAAYTLGTATTGTVTITSNDLPTVTITAPDSTARELGPETAYFRISRTGALNAPLTVNYSRSGTAIAGTDYALIPVSVTIPAGADSAVITILPVNDSIMEGEETVILTLTANANYVIGSPSSATVTIESYSKPTVNVSAPDNIATELPTTPGNFIISRNGATSTPLVVQYSMTGTATNGIDYATLSGGVTIPAGSTAAAVIVTPIDDGIIEAPETVVLMIHPRLGYNIGLHGNATVTILSNEVPTVAISASDPIATEAGPTTGTFRISRTGELNAPLTVYLSQTGTASAGVDFAGLPSSVTIPPGESVATVTVTPINDSVFETDETVVLTIKANPYYGIASPGSATVTIRSDDLPTVSVSATTPTAAEFPPASGQFRVTRSKPTSGALTVYYSVSGTATAGADYTALSGSVTIPAGVGSAYVTVTPVDDTLVESPETVILTLSSRATYTVGSASSATVAILSNETPTVTIQATDASAGESPLDAGRFRVTRNGSLNGALAVTLARSGTATAGVDYANFSTVVTILPGHSFAEIPITPINDATIEGNETVVLSVVAQPTYLVGSPSSATVTITSEDKPAVSISADDALATENPLTTGMFRISRSGSAAAPLTVYFTRSGTATAGSDYVSFPTSAIFAAGQSTVYIPVTPINDTAIEPPETVILSLAPNAAYTSGVQTSAVVTILSDETPVVTITASDPTASEAGLTQGAFRISRTGTLNAPLAVYLSRSGTAGILDYVDFNLTVTIPAGAPSATIPVIPKDDSYIEGPETVVLAIAPSPYSYYSVGSPSTATVTITSDDPNVTIAAINAVAKENPLVTGTFRVTRTGPTTSPLSVTFTRTGSAGAGSDYVLFPLNLTLEAGQAYRDITVTPVNDDLVEAPETVALTVNPGAGYTVGTPSSATVTIYSDEKPTVSIAAIDNSATEAGPTTGKFRVYRSILTTAPLTVLLNRSGTATAGSDYVLFPLNVTIEPGEPYRDITVTPINDSVVEGPETVTLTVAPDVAYLVGSPSSATVTITSDDKPVVTITAPDSAASESPLNTATFRVTRTGPTSNPLTVSLNRGGTAIAGSDFVAFPLSLSIPAGSSSANITLTPINDTAPEGSESVYLILIPGAGYTVGTPSMASVTITSEDVPNLLGTYTGSGSVTNSGCTFAGDNGTFAVAATVRITSQTGSTFGGSATFVAEGSINSTLGGTVNWSGGLTGSLTFVGSSQAGTLSFGGTLSGNTVSLSVSGTTSEVVDGRLQTCNAAGSMTVTR